MNNKLLLLICYLISIMFMTTCTTMELHAPAQSFEKSIEIDENTCQLKDERRQWYILYGTVPLRTDGPEEIREIIKESKDDVKITKQSDWLDVLLSGILGISTSISTDRLVVEDCTSPELAASDRSTATSRQIVSPELTASYDHVVRARAPEQSRKVYFKFNSAHIDQAARQEIQAIGSELKNAPELKILVVGHADRHGSQIESLRIAYLRAFRVKDALKVAGVTGARIAIVSAGNAWPQDKDRKENRVVRILLLP